MRSRFVILPVLALLAAACDDDNGTGSDLLTPEEVAGVYQLCTLRFQPSNTALPGADLLVTVVDTTPPTGRPEPTIALASNGTYDLAYTDQGSQFLEQIRGSIGYRENQITLSFPSSDPNAAALLMPRSLLLTYDRSSRAFGGDAGGFPYPVAREDYAAAAGISGEGLQSSINGTLQIGFRLDRC